MADDFCKDIAEVQERYMVEDKNHKHRNKPNRMSDAEIMVILILFHSGGFRCFKHYYKEYVCASILTHLFPCRVSYNRFVELEKEVLLQLTVFIKKENSVLTRGYIGQTLFENLFLNGIQLITKVKNNTKNSLMSVADKILLRKRALIKTVNDGLKNIAQIEHSRHRSFNRFIASLLSAIAAYCFFEKSPLLTFVSSKTGNLRCLSYIELTLEYSVSTISADGPRTP